jgi:flagellin
MPLYITNIAAMQSARMMGQIQSGMNTCFQRLSSGKRINSAKDDPAGFQIANRLTSQINGYKQGKRNLSDGIALAQVMEGAMDETRDMLQKIRTLAVQAATGTLTTADRLSITAEVGQYCQEINRIAKKTTYAGSPILNGNKGGLYDDKGKIQIQASGAANDTIGIPGFEQGFTISGISTYTNNASGSFLFEENGELRFTLSTAEKAQAVLGHIDSYINAVASYQGTLGGIQNRMESAIRLNDTMAENLADARSRIEDTDYAEECANLAALQIRQQACSMIMKQAFNNKNIILSLLGG